jgi:uncharacterized protein
MWRILCWRSFLRISISGKRPGYPINAANSMHANIILRVVIICFSFTHAVCQTRSETNSVRQIQLGTSYELRSAALGEKRIINVYLPDDYKRGDTTRYPVVYLLDGSVDEDFIHIAGLVQFSSFEWVNRIPKSILVGVATVDRRRDFTFPTTIREDKERFPTSGGADNFIRFIETELQPCIEKGYRTNGTKTIIGQSFGGLLATRILLLKPSLFNRYIIVSPSLWWDNGTLLSVDSPLLHSEYLTPTEVYIAVGKEGLAPGLHPRVMEVDANLLAEKLKASKCPVVYVHFDYLPDEDHATILHQAVANSFRRMTKVR